MTATPLEQIPLRTASIHALSSGQTAVHTVNGKMSSVRFFDPDTLEQVHVFHRPSNAITFLKNGDLVLARDSLLERFDGMGRNFHGSHRTNANGGTFEELIALEGNSVLGRCSEGRMIVYHWDRDHEVTLSGHPTDSLSSPRFSFDVIEIAPGRVATFAGRNGYSGPAGLTIWNTDSGEKVSFLDHDSEPVTAAVGYRGRFIITGSVDGFIKAWDIQSGTIVAQRRRLISSIDSLAVLADGTIVCGYEHGHVSIWNWLTQN